MIDTGATDAFDAAERRMRADRAVAVDADAGMVAAVDARTAVLPELPFSDGWFDAVVGNFFAGSPPSGLS
ncbi:Methyltransferase type 11 OS=Streptomyces aurantiogriseus OX=66870 GN=GCM10010251_19570 PE=4 SV=1 [Streptomyces aurantiogriseus]|uniref:Methyltransferase type 11 n=2 Tax=Streptomyces aurantiogriseus TaxID=66870 RepID=A0A918C2W6_9ACTN|nr:hypothetical protein GCM10010251_19570 [Streptomyces aurantiogriseus]